MTARAAVAAMSAYTLELREADIKLNQNESPFDFPFKDEALAAIGAFVGPGTPIVFARPTFALYEKLVTIAGGLPVPIDLDPTTGFLPLDAMLE